jgi:hypothetical protein
MNPATIAMAGMAASSVIGGILGSNAAAAGRRQQAAAAQAAYAQLQAIGMPPDLSREVILQHFQSQGALTPELEQTINLQASEVGQIKEDPSLRGSQMDVLNTLAQQSRGGLQAGDRAAYNELRASTQRDAEAKRQQILQQMQAQGQSGGGASLMAQLQASQGAADQQSAGADRMAAQASQNALNALSQRGQMAGNVRGQDFATAQAKAAAIDDRNKFLAQNSVAQQQRNIAAQNAAQAANLQNAQNLSNMNVGQTNTEALRQNQAKRDYFNDQLNLAGAKANALNNQGTMAVQGGQAQANMYTGMGNALAQGIGAYGNYASGQAKKPQVDSDGNPVDNSF